MKIHSDANPKASHGLVVQLEMEGEEITNGASRIAAVSDRRSQDQA
jgi:hypothetical protein